jgi:hypothetical protein
MFALLLFALLAQDSGSLAWQGTWKGELRNFPARAGAKSVEVEVKLGEWPSREGECAEWKTTYREGGEVKGVKDYTLCRSGPEGEYFVDEGNGVKLPARLLDGALVSQFKYGKTLLTTILELRDGVLVEHIYTAGDEAATEGVRTLPVKGVQKITLRRAISSQDR